MSTSIVYRSHFPSSAPVPAITKDLLLPAQFTCAKCAAVAEKMSLCGACKQVHYCDKTCQKGHWSTHKLVCKIEMAKELKEKKKDLMKIHHNSHERSTKEDSFYKCFSTIRPNTRTSATCIKARAFTVTNERGQDKIVESLQKISGEGEVFIGTSCLASLDLASVQENVHYIIVIDVSDVTRTFWKNVTPLIRESTSCADCGRRIIKDLETNIDVYFPWSQRNGFSMKTYISIVSRKLQETASFLSNKDRYMKIKRIFEINHFVFLHLDLSDIGACKEIRKNLDKLKLKTNTIYLSNIIEFIRPADLENYGKSLELLSFENSIVVDATDISYRTTKRISALYSGTHLEELYALHQIYGNSPPRHNTMRLRERNGQPMEIMFPFIAHQRKCKEPKHLFYDHGIEQGYYTEVEAEELRSRVDKALAEEDEATLSTETIVKITMKHITQQVT